MTGDSWKCEEGHSFDVAKEGYVNLLASNRKLGELVGDSKEMIAAREAFLATGSYDLLSEKIGNLVANHLSSQQKGVPAILDAGCGTGFYLAQLLSFLNQPDLFPTTNAFGSDVSKEAVRKAAKAHPNLQFLVADTNDFLPFEDGSLDVVMDIFAPRNGREFSRILAPDGLLLVVVPGDKHLEELRSLLGLLSIEEEKERKIQEKFSAYFTLSSVEKVNYQISLTSNQVRSLIMMTPNARHFDPTKEPDSMEVSAEFSLLAFIKNQS
jgi:23S rRNA (guanine745-N1)-methyltransferase